MKLKQIILPQEGKAEDEEATDLIIGFIEEEFQEYLEKNKHSWVKEYEEKIKLNYSFKWLKALSFKTINPLPIDKENKYVILCLIPKKLQEYIKRGSKEIETRVINILFRKKLFNISPNIYYQYIDDETLEKADFHKKIKEHIIKENAVIYAISVNANEKSKKQDVYLYNFLLKEKESANKI